MFNKNQVVVNRIVQAAPRNERKPQVLAWPTGGEAHVYTTRLPAGDYEAALNGLFASGVEFSEDARENLEHFTVRNEVSEKLTVTVSVWKR